MMKIWYGYYEVLENVRWILYEKYRKYLNNEDVELNSDDEKLFLSREERKLWHRKPRDIWKRILPPHSSEEVNSSINKF